ncbi:MAG: hypothetical protein IKB12_04905 [Clostridia bacterium]|nr:hypothetical protein [Clostridia bacterium]
MKDVMGKALALPLKVLFTPYYFFFVMIPAVMFEADDETMNKLWNSYWNAM